MRGYFEIGVYHPKTHENIGTLWRSAFQVGASGLFLIGRRFPKQSSDTVKAWRHVPLREFDDFSSFESARPYDTQLVGVEIGGKPLSEFKHPERAIYLLGSEDHGIPLKILSRCQHVVSIESARARSYNVAVAGAIVMYHRMISENVDEGEVKIRGQIQ